MTTIPVQQYNDETHFIYSMLDQRLYCSHLNIEIDISENEVFCPDCNNDDLTDLELSEYLINAIESKNDLIADYEIAEYLERSN